MFSTDTLGPYYAPYFPMKIVLDDLKLLSKNHLDAREVRTLRIAVRTTAP